VLYISISNHLLLAIVFSSPL